MADEREIYASGAGLRLVRAKYSSSDSFSTGGRLAQADSPTRRNNSSPETVVSLSSESGSASGWRATEMLGSGDEATLGTSIIVGLRLLCVTCATHSHAPPSLREDGLVFAAGQC